MKTSSVTHKAHTRVSVNVQLREYFIKVYRFMSLGLVVSAVCAFLGAHQPLLGWLYSTNVEGMATLSLLGWIVLLAPFALVFKLYSDVKNLKYSTAVWTFGVFSALMGLSLSSIFLVYAPGTIFTTFLICAVMFGSLSLYGQTTQRDLTSLGSILGMGVWGLLIAIIVNIFMHSAALDFTISIVGVGIFTGLIAYDTQRILHLYDRSTSTQALNSIAVIAALTLYLDFVNLFLFLLRLFARQRR